MSPTLHLKFIIWLLLILEVVSIQDEIEYSNNVNSDLSVKYSIIASKIVRPSTVYQLVVSLGPDSSTSVRVIGSIARNGVSISSNEVKIGPSESQSLLMKVPPDNSGQNANYVLRIEGHR